MITDTDHFWVAPTGDLFMSTRQFAGVSIVKGTELRGGDLVQMSGDVWRKFAGARPPHLRCKFGDHILTPIAYRAASDHYFAIVRPAPTR